MIAVIFLGLLPLAVWIWLLAARGGFWLARDRDDLNEPAEPTKWPSVVAVVPARNEADVIARSLGSLLAQDYPGDFRVILVDDQSDDGTAEEARAAAERLGRSDRLEVLTGGARPAGWTGKLWAVKQGIERARAHAPELLWLTDADIAHTPDNLRKLAARSMAGRYTLVSLMAKLNCTTLAERLLIPAFVFFFDMLYPFGWVNDPAKPTTAAAGGCMLIRRSALEAAGGIEQVRGEIIDDCAVGRLMKRQGPVWLGLTDRAVSIRPYQDIDEVRRMVSRSAYAELDYSLLNLVGTVSGMVFLYVVPPLSAIFWQGVPGLLGLATWAAMVVCYAPFLRFYRQSPLWGLALPVIGVLYTLFTIDSAVQVWRGRGGMWKGRAQALATLHVEGVDAAPDGADMNTGFQGSQE
jgi:hopene-associated glycosyltransferase HpnB